MEMEKPKTEAAQGKPLTSTQRVFDAVRDLRGLDQQASRDTVATLTGLKLGIVDDRLRALVDDGKLKRLTRGYYELVETFPPPRAIFCGILSDGMVKLEIGEQVLDLSPTEARTAARALGGFAEDARVIENGRQHLFLATELAARVDKLERALKAAIASKPDLQQHLLPI